MKRTIIEGRPLPSQGKKQEEEGGRPAKRARLEEEAAAPVAMPPPASPHYWFWPCDGRSYTLDELFASHPQPWPPQPRAKDRKFDLLANPPILTPSGKPCRGRYMIELEMEELMEAAATAATATKARYFLADKSRNASDLVCGLTLQPWAEVQPVLLNLTGRSYGRVALVKAIAETLEKGLPLRLEDGTIEPEQLSTIRLYPNLSLGTSGSKGKLSYKEKEAPISPFDPAHAVGFAAILG